MALKNRKPVRVIIPRNADNPRKLGGWGYEVNDSPQRKSTTDGEEQES